MTAKLPNDCFALPPGVSWTPVDTALADLKARLHTVVGTEAISIFSANGRILSTDVAAQRSHPPHANAAVDGYGLSSDALSFALAAGRSAAGHPFAGTVQMGQALRILTGASVPKGVDRIALQEDVTLENGHVILPGTLKPGANIRQAGEDIAEGQTVFPKGHILKPRDLGVLASVGVAQVQVFERLKVAVISTGDEVQDPGSNPDPHHIYDANRPMLLAQVESWGFEAIDIGIISDNRAQVRTALDKAAQADIILTSGGASAGDEDHIAALLNETGSMALWRIAIKPGRPLGLGIWNGIPVFALPGNPVAAFVCTLLFARPSMHMLAGAGFTTPKRLTLPADFTKRKKPGRREYLRARVTAHGVETFASEGSGRISGLSWAEGLVELPDEALQIAPGDPVTFLPFEF